MCKIKEAPRLEARGRADREIRRALKIGRTTPRRYRARAEEAGKSWPLPSNLTGNELEARLFSSALPAGTPRPPPDSKHVHRELRRSGVTLQFLWLEYREEHPDAYSLSRFCERYHRWRGGLACSNGTLPGPGLGCHSDGEEVGRLLGLAAPKDPKRG